jgi:glycine/D-amino acid oxidase-like deaminating enzyme
MQPLWAATAPSGMDFPELQRTLPTQLAVVGGGYTGLSAALHAAARGLDTALIDACAIGERASGLNGGQVIAGVKYDPDELLRRFGASLGAQLCDTVGSGPELVFDLIRRHEIQCDAVRNGWIQAALSTHELQALQARVTQWRRRGVDARLLDRRQIAQLTGAHGYCGGWLDPRGGTVQPLAYARGLARAAQRAGVRVYARTPAIRLEPHAGGWRVTTPGGSITANQVILATDAYTDGLIDPLRRSVVAVPSFQVATAPLAPELRASILPQGQSVSDTGPLLRYFRRAAQGRLLMGSRGAFDQAPTPDSTRHLYEAVYQMFPQLGRVAFEFHWSGLVAITGDRLPHLHALAPGLWAGLGYNGRGIAMATTIGRLLANLAAGDPASQVGFPMTPVRALRLHRFARLGARAALQLLQVRDRLQRRRAARQSPAAVR